VNYNMWVDHGTWQTGMAVRSDQTNMGR